MSNEIKKYHEPATVSLKLPVLQPGQNKSEPEIKVSSENENKIENAKKSVALEIGEGLLANDNEMEICENTFTLSEKEEMNNGSTTNESASIENKSETEIKNIAVSENENKMENVKISGVSEVKKRPEPVEVSLKQSVLQPGQNNSEPDDTNNNKLEISENEKKKENSKKSDELNVTSIKVNEKRRKVMTNVDETENECSVTKQLALQPEHKNREPEIKMSSENESKIKNVKKV